jgi:hypothetical protein
MHVCALEIAGEDHLDVPRAVDNVSRQMTESGPGRVGQVNGEEIDDEKVVVGPAHLACKAVVLQPDAEVSLTVVLNDVARHSKCFLRCMMLPNAFGPGSLGMRLHPLRLSWPLLRGFHTWCWDCASSSSVLH